MKEMLEALQIDHQDVTAYIATGDLGGFYTLRVYTINYFENGSVEHRDSFIQNLSTDAKKADQMLKEFAQIHGCDVGASSDFALNEHNKWSVLNEIAIKGIKEKQVLNFGKYSGRSFGEIIEKDLGYMQWLASEIIPNLKVKQSTFKLTVAAVQQLCEEGVLSIPEKVAKPFVEKKPSEFVGTVGEKIEVTGTVLLRKLVDGQFGGSLMIIMEDADGNIFKTFTTAKWVWEQIPNGWTSNPAFIKGDKIKLVATVSKHDDSYNKEKSTILKRPKLIEVMKEAA